MADNPDSAPGRGFLAAPRGFEVPGRSVGPARGIDWIREGWALFRPAPLAWVAALVLLLAFQALLHALPLAGGVAGMLLGPALAAGLLAFARGMAAGGPADFGLLLAGFRDRIRPLLGVAVINAALVAGIVLLALLGLLGVLGGGLPADPGQLTSAMVAAAPRVLVVLLLALLLLLPAMAALWFAPGLVVFEGLGAVAAMKASFIACLCNWQPLTVYGAVGTLLLVAGAVPLGLGLVVVVPVLAASYYASFADIFARPGP